MHLALSTHLVVFLAIVLIPESHLLVSLFAQFSAVETYCLFKSYDERGELRTLTCRLTSCPGGAHAPSWSAQHAPRQAALRHRSLSALPRWSCPAHGTLALTLPGFADVPPAATLGWHPCLHLPPPGPLSVWDLIPQLRDKVGGRLAQGLSASLLVAAALGRPGRALGVGAPQGLVASDASSLPSPQLLIFWNSGGRTRAPGSRAPPAAAPLALASHGFAPNHSPEFCGPQLSCLTL